MYVYITAGCHIAVPVTKCQIFLVPIYRQHPAAVLHTILIADYTSELVRHSTSC